MAQNQTEFIHLDCPRCGAPLQGEGDVLQCEYCRARLILKRAASAQSAAPAAQGDSPALRQFSYYDPQAGMEAFSILVPQGWQVSGGVTWVTSRPAMPVETRLQMVNPAGLEAFEALPTLFFTWDTNPLMQMTKPPGSLYFGYEVCQPMPAREVIRRFVLPRYRPMPDLQVVDEGAAQELLQVVRRNQPAPPPMGQYSTDAARVRLHYTLNGQPIAEELSGVVEYVRISSPALFGTAENVFWSMGYLTAFRAHRANLERHADLYRAILGSVQINPAFTAFVQQVTQGLSSNVIRHIRQIGDLSRQISRNSQQMREENLQGWQERSASGDRIAENFSQTIRGVDAYFDPNTGKTVELPSGYTQAWSTPLGEYILSEDPGFDPNIGSNQTWTPLTPQKP